MMCNGQRTRLLLAALEARSKKKSCEEKLVPTLSSHLIFCSFHTNPKLYISSTKNSYMLTVKWVLDLICRP